MNRLRIFLKTTPLLLVLIALVAPISGHAAKKSKKEKADVCEQALDQRGKDLGLFGYRHYWVQISKDIQDFYPTMVVEIDESDTKPKYPHIPKQRQPNCLAMAVAWSAEYFNKMSFEQALSKAAILSGDNVMRELFMMNPFYRIMSGSENSLEDQFKDFKSTVNKLGLDSEIVIEPRLAREQRVGLTFQSVLSHIEQNEIAVLGTRVALGKVQEALSYQGRVTTPKEYERWIPPGPMYQNENLPGHAMVLVDAFRSEKNKGDYVVLVDTATGTPIVISFVRLRATLEMLAWMKP